MQPIATSTEHMFNNSQGYKIGGLGLTVEVDESMFGVLMILYWVFIFI